MTDEIKHETRESLYVAIMKARINDLRVINTKPLDDFPVKRFVPDNLSGSMAASDAEHEYNWEVKCWQRKKQERFAELDKITAIATDMGIKYNVETISDYEHLREKLIGECMRQLKEGFKESSDAIDNIGGDNGKDEDADG